MSAQHRSLIDRVIRFVFLRPSSPVTTDWQRVEQPAPTAIKQETPPAVPVYPVLPPKPYRPGDTVRGYPRTHPIGPMRPITTRLSQLPPKQLEEVITKVPPRTIAPWQIANIPTAKSLDISQIPQQISDQIPVATGKLGDNQQVIARAQQMHALKHHPTTQIVSTQMPQLPEPICQPLKPEQLPPWLLEEPPIPPKNPSGFLLAREVVLEQEDPEATEMRKAIKIEKKKESE